MVTTEVLSGKISSKPVETIKEELIQEFGGLTVQGCKGSWLDNGKVYEDINEKWLILTEKEVSEEKIMAYAERLRVSTKQIAQLYRIDYKSFLIDAQGVVKEGKIKKQKKKMNQLCYNWDSLFVASRGIMQRQKKEIEFAFNMLTREQQKKFIIAQKEFEEIAHNQYEEYRQKLIQKIETDGLEHKPRNRWFDK